MSYFFGERRRRAQLVAALLSAGLGLGACAGDEHDLSFSASTTQGMTFAEADSFVFHLDIPAHSLVSDWLVSGRQQVQIGDRSDLEGKVASAEGDIEVGHDAIVHGLMAQGHVQVRGRSQVQGSISAGAAAQVDSSAIVTGTVQGDVPSSQTTRLSWEVQPGLNFGYPVHLEPEARLNLEGGAYGDLSLKSRSTLYLRTGTYVFENVRVEPDATLFVDSSEGPVQIYVQSSFGFRGIVRSATHQDPQLLFAYQGTEPVFIEAPYLGVVLAPQAEIRLQAARPEGHVGVFHGSRVLLGPDTKIQSPRFNWFQIVDDPALVEPLDGPEHWLHASPSRVSITAEGWREGTPTGSASWTTGDDYEFELKDELEVDGGIIGNGTLLLSYVDSSGRSQYCSYRGQLPKGQPSTLEEFALARTLRLVSCTDGLDASVRRRSGSFSLQVTGTPSFPVSVSPPITRDGACSEQLELLSAEQTVRMRESFSWEKAQKVVEYNEDGSPTLYFGWVYVRDQEELAAYRKLLIHQLNRPLFERDLEKFAGRCGVTTNPGDGEGTFVPSIIVGATYNRLIDAIHSDEIKGDKVLFDAVILGETPAEIQAAGGSISYQALAQAGIKYLNRRTAQGLSSQIELDGGAAKVFLDVTAWVAEAAVNITETALEFLGEIDELFRGDIDIDVGIFSFVPDPAFYKGDKKSTVTEFLKSRPKPMVRAWGQYRGYELGAQDMQVTLMQKMFGTFIPSESKGFTDKTGRARLDVVSGETRGNGLCFELKSQGAQISDYLLAKEICDFRGFAQNDLQIFGDFRLNRITEAQTKFPIVVDHPGLTGLYQSDDVHQWARSVMGFVTKRARVLSGYWATTLSPSTNISMPGGTGKRKGLYAPCLNLGNGLSDKAFLVTIATSVLADYLLGVPLVSPEAILTSAVLLNADIVMSENTKVLDSRHVMSHEYGHYLFCNMLALYSPLSMTALIAQTIAADMEAGILSESPLLAPIRYLNEAMADFFTGQVVGTADYGWLSKVYRRKYCVNNGEMCFDRNLDGTADEEREEDARYIGVIATQLHDLVDGRREGHRAHVPGNADLWELGEDESEEPPLVLAREQYGSFDDHLENVMVQGPAILGFAKHLSKKIRYYPVVNLIVPTSNQDIYEGLNKSLVDRGLTWCDRCRVFALHVPGNKENVQDLWKTCTTDEMLSSVLGPPPEEDLRMSAGPDQSLRLNTCDACPAGFFSDQDGSCRYCPEDAVVKNECQACKADVLIDGAEASDGIVKYSTLVSAAEDNCPDLFVLEVKNMDRLPARGIESVSAEMGIQPDYQGRFCSFPYTMTMQRLKKNSIARVQSANGVPCTSNPIVCGLTPCLNLPAFELRDFSHDVRWLTPRSGLNYIQLNLHKPAVIH